VKTILLLDDNTVVLRILGTFLRLNAGYCVLEATTLQEAIDQFNHWKHEIDLLVTDVCIAGESGKAVVGPFTTMRPDLRVLYISGYPQDHLVGNGVLRVTDPFLAKPFSPTVFLRCVRDVLDGSYQAPIVNGHRQASSGYGDKIMV